MDKKKHINILIDRVSLCYYKIEKAVFYFTDLFKIILYDAIYIFTILGKAYLVEPTDDDGKTNCDPGWQMKVPMVLFAILIIVFGLYSKPLMTFFTWVANGLL